MKETEYRSLVAKKLSGENRTIVEELQLRYDIGSYKMGKIFGMPDFSCDIISFDENEEFHLYELKILENNEIWTGKFFGQLLAYRFLFRTEPWNELAGRFAMRNSKKPGLVHGCIGRILVHLGSYGTREVAKPNDKNAEFKSLNLIVCGGNGYELAAGFNPIIWSYWVEFELILKEIKVDFNIYHFYKDNDIFYLDHLCKLSVDDDSHGGLRPGARIALEKDPDWLETC